MNQIFQIPLKNDQDSRNIIQQYNTIEIKYVTFIK